MILDVLNLFSNNIAVTATADSDTIDLGADRDLGVDTEIDVFMKVDTTLVAAGAATLDVTMVTATDSAFSQNVATLKDTGVVAKATLVQGYFLFKFKLPQVTRRYLKLTYTVATGPFTAGKVTAGLVKGLQNNIQYPAPNQA